MTDTTAESVASEIEDRIIAAIKSSDEDSDVDLDELINSCLPKTDLADVLLNPPASTLVETIALRGIRSFGPEQVLQLSEGLTIVYAGNGQGKTSLTDALELVTGGGTTRQISLPNAATEVKDKDHITHLKPNGATEPDCSPRVRVSYRRRGALLVCEWNTFGSPAANYPDIQVLPRRLLRELVNAKRTERSAPLGAALGLGETIDMWTGIAKELGRLSSSALEHLEPHLQLLNEEVPAPDDDSELSAALQRWAKKQSPNLVLEEPPSAGLWFQLAQNFSDNEDVSGEHDPLPSEHQSLLRSFLTVAEPGGACPACAQARVPDHRIEEVRRLLAESDESDLRQKRIGILNGRCDELAKRTTAWLQLAASERTATDLPSTWSSAIEELTRALGSRGSSPRVDWALEMGSTLSKLSDLRAELVSDTQINSFESRGRAIAAVRSNVSSVRDSLREQAFRKAVLSPLLRRAGLRVKDLLIEKVDEEFKSLEEPINDWLEILGPQGTPRIALQPVQTAHRPSLDLRVAKYPEGTTAPHVSGHFSDAQIDMLGMSAHLARIERDHPGAAIVIDDPSDMLDFSARRTFAREGIARLLGSDSGPSHQVVILTHDDQLVRELWDGHRTRQPATVQDTIERSRDRDNGDDYSVLTSRNAATATTRAQDLVNDFWDSHQDRVWFRAALAAHTRQAVEMCAKDISTLLGPAGIGLHPENRRASEHEDLGNVSDQIRATLRETSETWCSEGRHIPARMRVDELRDLFTRDTSATLNPGAHADVVLPEATASKAMLDRLYKVVALLDAPQGRPRSSWTTESSLAILLQSGSKCPKCGSSE